MSLAWVHSLIIKNISISSYSVCQTDKFQTIQFSFNRAFVYTQLDAKTVLFPTIQFSGSTVSITKTVLF